MMIKILCSVATLILLGNPLSAIAAEEEITRSGVIIDMHAHFFRMRSQDLIIEMDEGRIDYAVFMPVPNSGAGGKRGASDEMYLQAAKANPDRIGAFFGGNALNQELESTPADNVSQERKNRFRQRFEPILSAGDYKGIGELGPRHMAYLYGMREIEYPADHPLMLVLSDLAATYELPMDIHMEANEKTVAQLERLLTHNEKTKILWNHAGWSNTGMASPELLRRLLTTHANLYASIKYRRPENSAQESVRLLDEDGTLSKSWKLLFEEFPERFVIGTDVKLGDGGGYRRTSRPHRGILAQLSKGAAQKIATENAKALLRLK